MEEKKLFVLRSCEQARFPTTNNRTYMQARFVSNSDKERERHTQGESEDIEWRYVYGRTPYDHTISSRTLKQIIPPHPRLMFCLAAL